MSSTKVTVPALQACVQPVLSTAELRAVEAKFRGVDLMRRAGKAAAEFLMVRTTQDARIVLFAGPGNNGGDALACAAELARVGYAPVVIVLADVTKYAEDAARAWTRVLELCSVALPRDEERWVQGGYGADRNGKSSSDPTSHPSPIPHGERGLIDVLSSFPAQIDADWIVDGLFGIGLKRPLDGVFSDAVRAIAAARGEGTKVLALDVPSGIDADTGALVGNSVVTTDHTLTFLALKPGLLTGPALDYVGELHCDTLGVESSDNSAVHAIDHTYIDTIRHHHSANAHKGTNGTCVIIGGATGMLGAALLASRAAMRCGAGKVKLGWLADPAPQVDPLMPEVMMGTATVLLGSECSAMVVGCGLGVSGAAVRALKVALKREVPLVVDADALNLIAQSAELATLMQRRTVPTIITPHPAEAARLLGCSTADVQRDRLRAARDLAKGYHCIAVLKGAGTIICDGQQTTINRTGNPLLATAGTGDVLAGMIGALLAQGYDAATAARLGVCMHGATADALAARGIRRAVASDVISELANL